MTFVGEGELRCRLAIPFGDNVLATERWMSIFWIVNLPFLNLRNSFPSHPIPSSKERNQVQFYKENHFENEQTQKIEN